MRKSNPKNRGMFRRVDDSIVVFGRFLFFAYKAIDMEIVAFGRFLFFGGKLIASSKPKPSVRNLAFVMLVALLFSNVFGFSAFEAHIVNVTADLVNDIPMATPPGGKFCNTERIEVELSVDMEDAEIIYTINGDTPECGGTGILYNGPFIIQNSGILQARTCHGEAQSAVNSWVFDLKREYCGYEKQLLINKVYFDVDDEHGRDPKNEWIELYNPNDIAIELKDWMLCDSDDCGTINPEISIPALGYALVSHDASTWKYWDIPDEVPTIHQLGGKYFEMDPLADMLTLVHPDGDIVDQMNWGEVDPGWDNFNPDLWMPGIVVAAGDRMLGRVPSGEDTDSSLDWKVLGLPDVEVMFPNGGEKWYVGHTYDLLWSANNQNGADTELSIDIYYSADSGKKWALIVSDTENDGSYSWRVPLFLEDFTYYVPSDKARIKVVAKGSENFMIHAWDASDEDFCPPIDYELLTPEEIEYIDGHALPGENEAQEAMEEDGYQGTNQDPGNEQEESGGEDGSEADSQEIAEEPTQDDANGGTGIEESDEQLNGGTGEANSEDPEEEGENTENDESQEEDAPQNQNNDEDSQTSSGKHTAKTLKLGTRMQPKSPDEPQTPDDEIAQGNEDASIREPEDSGMKNDEEENSDTGEDLGSNDEEHSDEDAMAVEDNMNE